MSGVVYRALAADGSLLYVGSTINPPSRFRSHSYDKPWWSDVQTIMLEHFPTREAAIVAESHAIATEHPKHNVARSGRVASEEQLEERRRRREQRDREDEQRWSPEGRVVCSNCGDKPFQLPKGVALDEVSCPTCDVVALRLMPASPESPRRAA